MYLMAIPRLSDYLQLQRDRAPWQRLLVSKLRSPLSIKEWQAHEAIRSMTFEDNDPEAVFVNVRPNDVGTFLKLRDLLDGLQLELDLSWAILGEVCVRHKTLSRLGVTIRRVRSNIHDNRFLLPRLRFFPLRAAFEAADAELLTLLVQPLYGDDANFGIHELIQSPVDACLERQDVGHHDQAEILAQSEQEVDVAVSIDTKNGVHYLTISDKGIGMTANTVCEYFLRAGAFYRRSDSWRKLHEPDGLSRPLRSGRFGSGVLAGFLLSDEIKVSTRHLYATEMEGVEFSA